jgi:hypothetical protein
MTELKIPEAARRLACDTYDEALRSGGDGTHEHAEIQAVVAALPLAFAAELRELLREMEKLRLTFYGSDNSARAFGVDAVAHLLRKRIAKLDPKGLTA